jgi:hypothetical protein
MTMTDDLVKRLRIGWHDDDTPIWVSDAMDEAADRIEALTAERERAYRMRDVAVEAADLFVKKLTEAEAENDRAWAALWDILACETPNANATVTRMVAIAKAALTAKEPSHD